MIDMTIGPINVATTREAWDSHSRRIHLDLFGGDVEVTLRNLRESDLRKIQAAITEALEAVEGVEAKK